MRVMHMDSGLGNQMLDYAEFLAIRKMNPDEKIYLETIVYDLPPAEGMFSQWNGYELERIFGIKAPNIKELFDDTQWKNIVKKVEKSRFWLDEWNYAPVITDVLNKEGMDLVNTWGNHPKNHNPFTLSQKMRAKITCFFHTRPGNFCKRTIRKAFTNKLVESMNRKHDMYRKYPTNAYIGHSLDFRFKGFGIEKIEKELREVFTFPPITDSNNKQLLEEIRNCNSISIHVRRGDMLFVNGYCYQFGYFKRAVKYIKRNVKNPVFFFFCDEDSVEWCRNNEKVFGIDFTKDHTQFVTWNKGQESFRDMQLMKECKHNIFTESSFGIWGGILNQNPDKITCAPDCTIYATNSF